MRRKGHELEVEEEKMAAYRQNLRDLNYSGTHFLLVLTK